MNGPLEPFGSTAARLTQHGHSYAIHKIAPKAHARGRKCLQKLYDSGVNVVSLTCDGPSVNIATLKALEVKLSFSACMHY